SDDAGVYLLDADDGKGRALVATADFITPVCDDARRFGHIAAANALSDVYAMGGRPLFALNLCCFPVLPDGVAAEILRGAADALGEAGAALLGGHSVVDEELKFGLAVVGEADPQRLLTNAGARAGDRLLLTKPLGTGVLINAFKFDKLDAAGLEEALVQMERLNADAARLALAHDAGAATDVTGFGLLGHAWNVARASAVTLRFRFDALPSYSAFERLVAAGISTGCTAANRRNVEGAYTPKRALTAAQADLLVDPQTSGGLLIAAPAERADALLAALLAAGHRAAAVGEVLAGPPSLEVV
ncbi:MAG TPA: selenide, water dikinase SelD, partial [Thermoanaerobaculia bacterium]|nr:selenide, water dikinase SelD [Thermoanaerobaculia bacterium]